MSFLNVKGIVILLIVCAALNSLMNCSCSDGNVEDFKEELATGNLTEAEVCLSKVKEEYDAEQCALQLIKAYINAGSIDKAINVYECITPWHKGRDRLYFEDYERNVCELLRTALMGIGDYKRAWAYYPISRDHENDSDNAKDRFIYLSDVVEDMCNKGRQDEAQKFVDGQIRWFKNNVDEEPDNSWNADNKKNYSSTAVREKLMEQIDDSY